MLRLGEGRSRTGGTDLARPAGPLLWIHAETRKALREAWVIIRALEEDAEPLSFLVTTTAPHNPQAGIVTTEPPRDVARDVAAFLDHWRPTLCLWIRGDLRPLLLSEMRARQVPCVLVNGTGHGLRSGTGLWMPGLFRSAVQSFDHAFTIDVDARSQLERAGLPEDRIQATAALEPAVEVPDVNETRLALLSDGLGARPLWFAASPTQAELPMILSAHRQLMRQAPRLLLILAARDAAVARTAAQLAPQDRISTAHHDPDEVPEETVDMLLVETAEDLGLWLRLSPVTLMGGTFVGGGGVDPALPAALGSAIIHGPQTQPWTESYRRLQAAQATCALSGTSSVERGLRALLNPDDAARLALAAWENSSASSEVLNRVLDLIRQTIDAPGVA